MKNLSGLWFAIVGVLLAGSLGTTIAGWTGGWNGVSLAGTIASFLGLAISLPTLLVVQQIRRRYLRQRVCEDHVRRLKTLCRRLDSSCSSKDAAECRKALARLSTVLKNLRVHLRSGDAIESIEKQLAEVSRAGDELVCVRAIEISATLHGAVEAVDIEILEIEWGRDDA